jgi:hypothetical protein
MKLHDREFLTTGKRNFIRFQFRNNIHRKSEAFFIAYEFRNRNQCERISNYQEYSLCVRETAKSFATPRYWYEIDQELFDSASGRLIFKIIRREPEHKPNGGQS